MHIWLHASVVFFIILLNYWWYAILFIQELEKKRKEKSQVVYERKKQLGKLHTKAEKAAQEKLASQLEVLAPVTYWKSYVWFLAINRVGCWSLYISICNMRMVFTTYAVLSYCRCHLHFPTPAKRKINCFFTKNTRGTAQAYKLVKVTLSVRLIKVFHTKLHSCIT